MTSLKLLTFAGCCLSTTMAWAAPNAEPSSPPSSAANSQPVASPQPTTNPRPPESPAATPPAAAAPAVEPAATAPAVEPAAATAPAAAPQTPPVAASAAVEPSPYGSVAAEPYEPSEEPERDDNAPATLWNSKYDYAFGGMGGVGVMYTRFGGKNSVLVCGEGAVIIDHALSLGGGGCGLARRLKADDYSSTYTSDERMAFGYGGAIGRYHFLSRNMVNLSVGVMVGAGGVTTGTWQSDSDDVDDDDGRDFKSTHNDALFIVEPQIGAHLNLTRWLRLGATAGYRFVSAVDTVGLEASDISGIVAGGQLQAGWF